MLYSAFVRCARTIRYLPDAGTWRNNHVYEGISDGPRANGTLMG
jgi:hypothetical protein